MMKAYIAVLLVALTGCSAIADFAISKLGGSSGGINTELVVGDKEQTLGNNIEVKADRVNNVIGNNDNTTNAKGAEFVEVNNINYPTWLIVTLLLVSFLFLCLPTPTNMYKAFTRWRHDRSNK
jgi:hypothetical protein